MLWNTWSESSSGLDSVSHWLHPLCQVHSILDLIITLVQHNDIALHKINGYFDSLHVCNEISFIGVILDRLDSMTCGMVNLRIKAGVCSCFLSSCFVSKEFIEQTSNKQSSLIKIWFCCNWADGEEGWDKSEFHI